MILVESGESGISGMERSLEYPEDDEVVDNNGDLAGGLHKQGLCGPNIFGVS